MHPRRTGRPQEQQHGHGLPLAAKTTRQLGWARRFEQTGQSERLSGRLFNTHHQLRRQQGVATEGKEVIVGADPRQPQNLGEEATEPLLQQGFRQRLTDRRRHIGQRQPLAIQLAIGGEWQFGQSDQESRHHVIRQRRAKGGCQLGQRQLATICGHHIGHQTAIAGANSGASTTACATRGWRSSTCSNLLQFDALATDLHLKIEAPQILDGAILAPGGQIAATIEPSRSEGVGNKALGGELGLAKVALRHLYAADPELPRHTGRHRLQPGVENVDAGIPDRIADGHAGHRLICPAGIPGDIHRRLGRAIEVVQGG